MRTIKTIFINSDAGTALRRMRKRRGLSQIALGIKTGHNRKTISKWENGVWTKNITFSYIAALNPTIGELKQLTELFKKNEYKGA